MRLILFFIFISFYSFSQDKQVFRIVEETPEFIGKDSAYRIFLNKNFKYPAAAYEKGIEGKCYLKFVVNDDSTLSDVEISKGVPNCPECDKEAIRLIKLMPKWKPGKQDGQAVNSYYDFLIVFKIPKTD